MCYAMGKTGKIGQTEHTASAGARAGTHAQGGEALARDVKLKDWEDEDHLALLRSVSDQSIRKIAEFIGIAPSTMGEWKKKSPKIAAALSQDNPQREINVNDSIYRSTHDRVVPTVEVETIYDENGKAVGKKVKEKQVVIPASFAAQRYWAERCRETSGGAVAGFIPVPDLMDEPMDDNGEEVRAIE